MLLPPLLHLKKHKICNGYSSCIGMHSQSLYMYMCCCLTHSLARAALMHWCRQLHTHTHTNKHPHYSPRTNACTDGANKKCMHMHVHVCLWCECVCLRAYIHTLCMSLPHPRMLPRTHTNTHTHTSPRSNLVLSRFVLVVAVAVCVVVCVSRAFSHALVNPTPPRRAIMSRQHHHRFISFTRT